MKNEEQKFHSLFQSLSKIKLIKWKNKENVGVSVLKFYPKNKHFLPIKNQRGKTDTVCMIKVGYYHENKILEKNSKVPLHLSIGKTSLYKVKHPWYDYSDNNSPSEEQIKSSEATRQPIELDDFDRYEYYYEEGKIFDKKTKSFISAKLLIDNFYKLHLRTLTNIPFLLKLNIQRYLLKVIDPVKQFLINTNLILFGKRIKESKEFLVGVIKPYKINDLEDVTLDSDKLKIFGSDFPISYQSSMIFIGFVFIIFILNFYFTIDLFGTYALFNEASKNSIYIGSLVATILIVIDRLIPYIIFVFINLLIKLNAYLTFMKIKLND